MKQKTRLPLFFILCLLGFVFSTTQALGGFHPNTLEEQQAALNQENHSIKKGKSISKQEIQRNKKNRKRFRKVLKNTDRDIIGKLSSATLFLGILTAISLIVVFTLGVSFFIELALVSIILGVITGIVSLVRIKKSDKDHEEDKRLTKIGLFLSLLPVLILSIILMIIKGHV